MLPVQRATVQWANFEWELSATVSNSELCNCLVSKVLSGEQLLSEQLSAVCTRPVWATVGGAFFEWVAVCWATLVSNCVASVTALWITVCWATLEQLSDEQLSSKQLFYMQLSGEQLFGKQLFGEQLSGEQLSSQQLRWSFWITYKCLSTMFFLNGIETWKVIHFLVYFRKCCGSSSRFLCCFGIRVIPCERNQWGCCHLLDFWIDQYGESLW